MKIIGKTADGYIVDISDNDLANLTGFYSHYSDAGGFKTLKAGDTVNVSKMYHHLLKIALHQDEMLMFSKKLQEMSELLSNPVIPFSYNEISNNFKETVDKK